MSGRSVCLSPLAAPPVRVGKEKLMAVGIRPSSCSHTTQSGRVTLDLRTSPLDNFQPLEFNCDTDDN